MVVMCLVTTFMTCPVVNCIYPVHLRVLASEAENKKLIDVEEGSDKEDREEEKSPEGESVSVAANGVKLGVIVDRMEHLQGIMDLLSCFTPYTAEAKLAVTGESVTEN